MKYYLIAGEASGDLHGSNLVKGLKKSDAKAEFRFFGGDLMAAQGGKLIRHYREMAFMGIIDVLRNIRTIGKNFKVCRDDVIRWKPDVLILIDFAGFNLRMAKIAKENNIKVFFYISPKVWAWQENRVKKIKKYVDKLFVILPFEVEYFKSKGIEVDYEGNPLTDSIGEKMNVLPDRESFIVANKLDPVSIVALLAGSRTHEIDLLLPVMIRTVKGIKGYQFVIAGAPSIPREYYDKYIHGTEIKIVYDQTYALLKHSEAALVTSGTATLETALMNVPQVVLYKTAPLQYNIGKYVVHITYFSLVNLILGRELVKELLQKNLVRDAREELKKLLFNAEYKQKMLEGYAELRGMTGKRGVSDRIAARMVGYLKQE